MSKVELGNCNFNRNALIRLIPKNYLPTVHGALAWLLGIANGDSCFISTTRAWAKLITYSANQHFASYS